MSSQWENIRKTRSHSSSQPSQQGLFRQRPFSEPSDNDEVSPHEQEVPDLQRHLDNESRFGYNFSRVKVSPYKPAIEPKFTFEPPTDKYEQEAAQTVEKVTGMAAPVSDQSIQRKGEEEELRAGEKASAPLTQAQVNDAKAWYSSRRKQYTPDIIKQIQEKVATEPDGLIGPLTIQAVAKWQQDIPSLTVDGKAGPRTLPAMFPTGLAQKSAINQFVGAAKKAEADWANLKTSNERADALLKPVNQQLIAAGVPACQKNIKDIVSKGQFDPRTWTIILSQRDLQKPTLTHEEAEDIAETVYHEARHAEQNHMMARMMAGKGKSSEEIQIQLQIPPNIASDAASKPLKPGSMEALIAEGWYESKYGSQAAYRVQVLKQAKAKKEELKVNEAEDEFNKNPTAANKAKKEAVRKQFEATPEFKRYQDLPEEADAWRVGEEFKDAYLQE